MYKYVVAGGWSAVPNAYDEKELRKALSDIYTLDREGLKRRLAREHGRRNRHAAFRDENLEEAGKLEAMASWLRIEASQHGDMIELSSFITTLLVELLDHFDEYPRVYTPKKEGKRPRKIRNRTPEE